MVCQAMIDRYCQEVAIAVKSSGVQDPALLKQLRCDLEEFLEEHPNAAEPELRKRFGQPEFYATEYFAAMDAGRQRKVLADKKFRRKVLVTTVAAILAVVIGLALWIGIRNSQSAADYFVMEVIEGAIGSPYGGDIN